MANRASGTPTHFSGQLTFHSSTAAKIAAVVTRDWPVMLGLDCVALALLVGVSTMRLRGIFFSLHHLCAIHARYGRPKRCAAGRPCSGAASTDSADAIDRLKRLYAPFNRNHDRIVTMDVRAAELTKYAANAMLATKISFMNEIANIAERVGADIEMVRHGIGSDPRIGWHFIYPGAGYGGSCFPKDVQALARTAQQMGYEAKLLNAVEAVNDAQKGHLFELIQRHYDKGEGHAGQGIRGKTFAVWGLAFKPNTDDMREASSRRLLPQLWEAGAKVRAFDPEAAAEAGRVFGDRPDLTLCDSAAAALEGADALVIVTEWKQFRSPDFTLLKAILHDQVVFDGRNVYNPPDVESAGLAYYGIGRGRSLVAA